MRLKSCKFFILMVPFLTVIMCDYFNFFSMLGLDFSNFNLDLWNIVVVIVLFIFTYRYIESANSKRQEIKQKREDDENENKYKISVLLLKSTYNKCKETIDFVDSDNFRDMVKQSLKDGDYISDNTYFQNYKTEPFGYEDILFPLMYQGILKVDRMEKYLKIKALYESYLSYVFVCAVYPDTSLAGVYDKNVIIKNINKEIGLLK